MTDVDYGFCYHWAFQHPTDRVDAIMGGIANVRAKRVRTAAPWLYVQTSKTVFDWSGTDYAVNKALSLGLKVLLLINGRPTWAATAADFGIFSQMCAQRFGPGGIGLTPANRAAGRGVTEFELWNEPNHAFFWASFPVSPNDYTAYVKAAYAGIKAVLPGAQSTVVLGGFNATGSGMFGWVAQPGDQFLTSCYAAGIKGNFDAVAHHPYTVTTEDAAPWAPTVSSTYIAMADSIHAIMVANGDGAMKIWATEMGWPVPTLATQAQQALYFPAFRAIWEAKSYAGPWYAFEYYDEGTDTTVDQMMYGVVDNALNPKAAYAWFRNLNGSRINPALSATGTLSALTAVKKAVTLTAVGALTAIAVATAPVTAALSTEGTLSATVEIFGSKSAKLTADGTLTATAVPSFARPAALAANGTLTATVVPGQLRTPALTAVGTLSASVGVFRAAKTFTYDFTGTGSTKPTSLFTDFGVGYSVTSSVANDNTGSTNGQFYAGGIYNTDHVGYDQSSTVHVGPLGDSFDRSSMAIVRATPDGLNWVGSTGHFPSAGGCQIISCVGGVVTERAVGGTGFGTPDDMTLTAVGSAYSLYKNGDPTPVLTWIDGAGVFAPHMGKRTGFGFQFVYSNTTFGSPGIIGLWTGKDLADAVSYASQSALAASGTLTAVVGLGSGQASLAAAGTLTAVAKVGMPGPLTATGVLSATQAVPLAAALSATGALSATAGNEFAVAAALSSSGALTAVAQRAFTPALSATGTLTATAVPASAPALSSSGALTATVAKPITYDATGVGLAAIQAFSTSINITWSHTASGLGRAVVVGFTSRNGAQANSGQTRTVTYGGVPMTLLGTAEHASDVFCELWILLNPATGAQTVSVTVSSVSNTGRALVGNSVSYNGVDGVGAIVTTTGSSSAGSQPSVVSAPGERIAQLFGTVSAAQSAYNQTQRANGQSSDGFAGVLIGDAPGASSVSFSDTLSGSTAWGAIASRLLPIVL